jgi:hypothetical protein
LIALGPAHRTGSTSNAALTGNRQTVGRPGRGRPTSTLTESNRGGRSPQYQGQLRFHPVDRLNDLWVVGIKPFGDQRQPFVSIHSLIRRTPAVHGSPRCRFTARSLTVAGAEIRFVASCSTSGRRRRTTMAVAISAPHPRRPSIPLAHDKRCLMALIRMAFDRFRLPTPSHPIPSHPIPSHLIAARALGRSGHCGGKRFAGAS